MRISLADAQQKLPLPPTERWPDGVWDTEAYRHGSMSLLLFTPRGRDYQTPHEQDELYVVLAGSGVFVREGERLAFEPGDVLFAPAGAEHRFERFSDDLVTWVVFWGPAGGEAPKGRADGAPPGGRRGGA
jgi:mannose-6-phosphate isomerase-like protein (cupin superfamily)